MNQTEQLVMGSAGSTAKAPGHWVLARLGKRVLRPGGAELTRRMLDALAIGPEDDVVEFAPGLGATARLTLRRGPRSYVAVERDTRAAEAVRRLLADASQRCVVGRAEDTGLAQGRATVVYGEAMLTMQPPQAKSRIVSEAARLLAPGGRYGIHEVALAPDTLPEAVAAEIRRDLSGAIHHTVLPATLAEWKSLLEAHGLHVVAEQTSPMHLLEPRRLLADEGVRGAMKFAWNLCRDAESRRRVLHMRQVFQKHRAHLMAVAMVGVLNARPKQACGNRRRPEEGI